MPMTDCPYCGRQLSQVYNTSTGDRRGFCPNRPLSPGHGWVRLGRDED